MRSRRLQYFDELDIKDLNPKALERKAESRRLAKLKKILQAKIALERKQQDVRQSLTAEG